MAAIIYDDKYEALIIMSKPADHVSPDIPAVFISQKSGLVLKKLMTPGVSVVMITPVRPCCFMQMAGRKRRLDCPWHDFLLSVPASVAACMLCIDRGW